MPSQFQNRKILIHYAFSVSRNALLPLVIGYLVINLHWGIYDLKAHNWLKLKVNYLLLL